MLSASTLFEKGVNLVKMDCFMLAARIVLQKTAVFVIF